MRHYVKKNKRKVKQITNIMPQNKKYIDIEIKKLEDRLVSN